MLMTLKFVTPVSPLKLRLMYPNVYSTSLPGCLTSTANVTCPEQNFWSSAPHLFLLLSPHASQ